MTRPPGRPGPYTTERAYPVNVIAEAARDVLYDLDREFCDAHPTVHRSIAAEAQQRLGLCDPAGREAG